MKIEFSKVTSREEREAIDLFFIRHNDRGFGSTKGYRAYYAATWPPDGRDLVDRIVAAAKICPLHTETAARFYGAEDWRHVYCLQRLAADHAPENLLSQFLGWVLKQEGRNPKVHYMSTYASTGDFNQNGIPHSGGIYRATNAVYCGMTKGGHVEAYILDGVRHSRRRGPKTIRLRDIPPQAKLIRAAPMHRYCWAVGSPLERAFRRHALEERMARFQFQKVYQPRLLVRLISWFKLIYERKTVRWKLNR